MIADPMVRQVDGAEREAIVASCFQLAGEIFDALGSEMRDADPRRGVSADLLDGIERVTPILELLASIDRELVLPATTTTAGVLRELVADEQTFVDDSALTADEALEKSPSRPNWVDACQSDLRAAKRRRDLVAGVLTRVEAVTGAGRDEPCAR